MGVEPKPELQLNNLQRHAVGGPELVDVVAQCRQHFHLRKQPKTILQNGTGFHWSLIDIKDVDSLSKAFWV